MARAAELTTDNELTADTELTGDSESAAENKPIEAKPLRPGKAARAVVSDGRALRDAVDAVLAAPGVPRGRAARV